MPQVNESPLHQLKGLFESREFVWDKEAWLKFGNWKWDPKTDVFRWSRGMYVFMDLDPDEARTEITDKWQATAVEDLYKIHLTPGQIFASGIPEEGSVFSIILPKKHA